MASDPEMLAINTVTRTLAGLKSDATRSRVLGYVTSRLEDVCTETSSSVSVDVSFDPASDQADAPVVH